MLAIVVGGLLALEGRAAFAQVTYYNPATSGSWSVGSTWSGGVVPPNSTTTTYVIGMGGRTISVGAGDAIQVNGIELGHGSHAGGGAGLLTMSGGSLQSASNFTVGSSDAGTFTQTGGSVTAASVDLGTFYARNAGRTTATWTMSGTAALTVMGTLRVGPNTQGNQFAGGLNGTFTQGGTSTVSIGGDILIGATLNPSTAITNVYNLDSGTLTLSGRIGSPGTQANSTNNFVFNGGTLVYNGTSDRTTFLQGLSNAFVKAGGASIDTGGRSLTIAQPLLTDATSTGGGLTKLGSGTLALAGVNTYTGTTTASAGTIGINNNLALQVSVLDTAGGGGFLLGSGSITTPTFGGLAGGTNLATALGNYAQVTALTLNPVSGRTVTYSGTIANGAAGMSLTKSGSGTQVLTANNTYTGTTSITAGTLQIGSNGTTGSLATSSAITGSAGATLAFSRSDTVTQGSEFASTIGGAMNVAQLGSGTLVLNGANTHSGTTTASAGTIGINNNLALQNSVLDTSGAGGFLLGSGSITTPTFGGLTGATDLATELGNYAQVTAVTLNPGAGRTVTYSGAIADGVAGTTLTKTGAGTQILAGTSTYTGATTVTAGMLLTTSTAALPGVGTSAIVFNGGILGVQVGGSGWTTAEVDTLLAGATKTAGALGIDTTNGGLTQWTAFTTANFGPTLGLVKLGTGTLALSATNTYTGTTSIVAGTLQIGSSGTTGSLATSSAITGSAGATLAFSRSDTVTQGSQFASGIGGAINVSQLGSGTLVLNGINTYTGTTTVAAGVLTLAGGGSGQGTIRGTLAINQGGQVTTGVNDTLGYNTNSTAIDFVTITGGTLTTTTGFQTTSARFTLTGGVITGANSIDLFNNTAAITTLASSATSTISVPQLGLRQNDTAFTIADGAASLDLLVTSQMVDNVGGNHNLVKSGAGTMAVTATNTYTGSTRINAGTLQIGTGGTTGALSTSSPISGSAGGTLAFARSDTVTQGSQFASVISGSINVSQVGSGTLVLTGSNTYAGTTTVSGGVLQIGDGTNATARAGTGAMTVGTGTIAINLNASGTLGNSSVATTSGGLVQNIGTGRITLANGSLGAVDGGTAGVVLSNLLTTSLELRGDVTFGSSNNTLTAQATAPGATARVVTTGSFWWLGGTTAANALNVDVASGVTASLNTGQGAGALYYNNLSGSGNFTYNGNATGYILGTSTLSGTLTAGNRDISFGNGGATGAAGGTRIVATSTVAFNSTTDNTYSGVMSGGGALVKNAANVLTLTGSNTYAGTTTVSGGVLQIGDGTNATARAGTGAMTVGTGTIAINLNASGTLGNSSVATTSGGLVQNIGTGRITLANGSLGAVDGGTAGVVLSNLLTTSLELRGDVTFGSSNNTLTAQASAPGATARVVTTGSFWWLGGTTAANALNVDVASGVTASLNTGQGAGALYYNNLSGSGNFTYNGNATGYILGTSTLSGTLTAGNRDISFGNGGATGAAGGTRIVATSTVAFNSTTDNTYSGVMSGGGALVKNAANVLTLTGSNTYVGTTTVSGGMLQIGDGGTTGALSTSSAITGSVGATLAFSRTDDYGGSVGNTIGGGLNLVLNSGTLTLTAANTHTGTTQASAGTLVIANNLALQNSVLDTSAAGAVVLGSGSITTPTFGGLAGATDLATELGNYTQVTALTLNPGSGRTVTYSGTIANGAAGMTLTKTGAGTQILTAANTYSGATTVSGGVLQIGDGSNATARAGTGAMTVGTGTIAINLNASGTLGNSSVATTSGGLVQNIGTGRVTLANGSLANVDGGTAGIVLSNLITANLVVRGDVTFGSNNGGARVAEPGAPGATARIVNAGSFFWFGSQTAANAMNVDIASGVTVSLNTGQGAGALYYGNLSGSGNFTYNGNATGFILGTSTLGGTLTAGNRDISFGNGGATGAAGATRIQANANVAFNSTTDNTYSGVMSGVGALVKNAANVLTITGSNTYTGATTINAGTLRIGSSGTTGSLSTSSAISGSAGATLAFFRSDTVTSGSQFAAVIGGAINVSQLGSGTLVLNGANTYTGTTTISAGRLALGANGSFANSTSIIVGGSGSSGAVLDLAVKTGAFAIGAGQRLSGGGTVKLASSGTLSVLGTFAPGNSPGLFTYEAGTTVLSGTTVMEIFGTSRATSPSHGSGFYDAVDVNGGGLLQLGGLLMLEFNQAFADNTTFDLFSALGGSSLGGNFAGVNVVGSFYNDLSWSQASGVWKSSNTVDGQSLEFTAATGQLVIVPEPGAIALVGIGLAVAGWSAARRRRQAA